MPRLISFLLAILASAGLMLPPAQTIHAHEDGGTTHAHGVASVLHVPIHAHSHGHPHAPPPEPLPSDRDDDSPDGPDESQHDERAPGHHAHVAYPQHAIARPPGGGASSGASSVVQAVPAFVAILSSSRSIEPLVCGSSFGRDAAPPGAGTQALVLRLGRLLI